MNKKYEMLLAKARANGNTISQEEIAKVCEVDSEEYDAIFNLLSDVVEITGVKEENEEEEEFDENNINLEDVEEVDTTTFDLLPQHIAPTDHVKKYLAEIGQVPLLTFEEEAHYAKIAREGYFAQEQLKEIDKQEECTMPIEDYQALKVMAEKGKMAKDKLVSSNLRLVVAVAKKYSCFKPDFLDLIQEGNMGLMKAVDKFDPSKGFKFSTYATWWIRQAITRAIADQSRTIRIPVHMVETINKMMRTRRALVQTLNREPSDEELAKALDISVTKLHNIERISIEPDSLDKAVGEEEDSTLGDFIGDEEGLNPYQYTEKKELKKELAIAMSTLTDREREVLIMRFGLRDGKQRTLEEVGTKFGVTRERIRQIESKALRKLKHPSRSKKLRDFIRA